jgi:hypothetical protein
MRENRPIGVVCSIKRTTPLSSITNGDTNQVNNHPMYYYDLLALWIIFSMTSRPLKTFRVCISPPSSSLIMAAKALAQTEVRNLAHYLGTKASPPWIFCNIHPDWLAGRVAIYNVNILITMLFLQMQWLNECKLMALACYATVDHVMEQRRVLFFSIIWQLR